MRLGGRLKETTLGDVLGQLCRGRISGTLELVEDRGPAAGRVHRVHLLEGRIAQVHTPLAVTPLGSVLARMQGLDLEPSRGGRALDLGGRKPVGRALVDAGLASEAGVESAVRVQLKERLGRLFELGDARILFRVARPRDRGLDPNPPLFAEEFLRGRPRLRDLQVRSKQPRQEPSAAEHGSHTSPGSEPPPFRERLERRRALLVLGLEPVADDSASIRRAFRRMAHALHPDRHLSKSPEQLESLRRRFVEVSAAYRQLTSDRGPFLSTGR